MISEKVKDYINKLNIKDKKELRNIINDSILEEEMESAPEFIRNTFIITQDKKDILTNKELDFIIEESNISITPYNLRNFLKGYGAKSWRNAEGRGLSGVKIIN